MGEYLLKPGDHFEVPENLSMRKFQCYHPGRYPKLEAGNAPRYPETRHRVQTSGSFTQSAKNFLPTQHCFLRSATGSATFTPEHQKVSFSPGHTSSFPHSMLHPDLLPQILMIHPCFPTSGTICRCSTQWR